MVAVAKKACLEELPRDLRSQLHMKIRKLLQILLRKNPLWINLSIQILLWKLLVTLILTLLKLLGKNYILAIIVRYFRPSPLL